MIFGLNNRYNNNYTKLLNNSFNNYMNYEIEFALPPPGSRVNL